MKKTLSVIIAILIAISTIPLAFAAGTVKETESNDNFSYANQIKPGETIEAYLSSKNDKDCFKFTPSSNGKLDIFFNHIYEDYYGDWVVKVYEYYNSTYTQFSTGYTQQFYLSGLAESELVMTIGVVKGISYYISVEDGANYTSSHYSINIEFSAREDYETEFNNDFVLADLVKENQTIYANLYGAYDDDYFYIKCSEDKFLNINFNHTSRTGSVGWYVNVYKYVNNEYVNVKGTTIYYKDSGSISIFSSNVKKDDLIFIRVWDSSRQNMFNQHAYMQYSIQCITQGNHTLSYNANGGSGAPSAQTGSGSITLSSTKPTRSGYTFIGWASSSSATSAQYQPGSSYYLNSDTTLYAVWQSNSQNNNGGDNGDNDNSPDFSAIFSKILSLFKRIIPIIIQVIQMKVNLITKMA